MEEKNRGQSLRRRVICRYGGGGNCSALMVLRGDREATVYACRKILVYTPCEIRLLAAGRPVSVQGTDLFCTSFSGGTVTVRGRITGVCYCDCDGPDGGGKERE